MSLDDAHDEICETIAELLQVALNEDLAYLGETIVESIQNAPIPLARIPLLQLPALNVYQREIRPDDSASDFDRINLRVIRIDWIAPATPTDSLGPRWNLLSVVWDKIEETLKRGGHASYEDGDDVLLALGMLRDEGAFDSGTSRTLLDFALGDEGQTYPAIQAQVGMRFQTDFDIALEDPPDLEIVHTGWDDDGVDPLEASESLDSDLQSTVDDLDGDGTEDPE